jgi:hypothetical protein
LWLDSGDDDDGDVAPTTLAGLVVYPGLNVYVLYLPFGMNFIDIPEN